MEAGGTTRLFRPGRSLKMSTLTSYSNMYGLQARAQSASGNLSMVRRLGSGRLRGS